MTTPMDGHAAQAYLDAIVTSSDDAIIAKDLDGVIQWCNAAAERIFGYPSYELIGQSVRILIPPERQSEEDEILARVRRGDRIEHFETVRRAKEGRLLDISLTVSPVRDARGAIIGVSKTARDITAEKRAARALAAQQEGFGVLLATIGDAFIAADAAGRVSYMNGPAETITGWTAAAAKGQRLEDVFHIISEETRQRVPDPAAQAMRGGQVVGLGRQTLLIGRDGRERPIAHGAASIKDAQGTQVGVVVVFRDVTRLELDRQSATVDRERSLEAERLARMSAERANRLKDDFVAMVSHELRTPLNAIVGWVELVKANRENAPLVSHGLEVLSRNARRQGQLISDLLDISRMVAGKLRLELQPLDLAAIVTDAVETMQQEASAKGVALNATIEPQGYTVAGDPGRLQQVLWNLLSNAIKFTPTGGEVVVTVRRTDANAEISIADTGTGIRPEFLPHVFDRFQQADRSITRRFGGLGLGLSIVKHIVELHGGTVYAASRGEGKGTTFTVTLPTSTVADTSDSATSPHEPRHAPARAVSLEGTRILVVEDEPDTREFLARLLKTQGASVFVAASAAEALAIFSASVLDVIVSDIGLQDTDGYDFIGQIRARPSAEGGAIPAIALTAYARGEDRTRALAAGYQVHLAKPIEPAELVAAVGSLVGLIEAHRQARHAPPDA